MHTQGNATTMNTAKAARTVLLVDDDIDFLTQQRLQLQSAGYNVVTAESAEDGTRALEDTQPDVAIIDLMMESHDAGFTLAYRIKKRYPDVPVIMITAVTHETRLAFKDAAGGWVKADAVLDKPVRFEQLQREIDRLLGSK
jgi:CheY-like chemotaxis protein